MTVKLTNNASTLLSSGISDTDAQLAVSTGTGALFPSLGVGEWFPLTVVASTGEKEIMRATGRTGDVIDVERAQEGTAARAFDAGARVDLRVTAAVFDDVAADLGDAVDAAITLLQGQLNAPTGTKQVFHQNTAPTGWTKETNPAYNDAVVIATTGNVATAGTVAASTLFARTATDGHALTEAENGPHTHGDGTLALASGTITNGGNVTRNMQETKRTVRAVDPNASVVEDIDWDSSNLSLANLDVSGTTGSSGSGDAHTHPIDMRVKRYSVILATKS